MTFHDRCVGSVLFPFSQDLLNRRRIRSECAASIGRERWSAERIASFQWERLGEVVARAYRYVPYYSRLFREVGFRPEALRHWDDLRRITPLSREDVIGRRTDLVDRRYRSSREKADASNRPPGAPLPFARFRPRPLVRNTSSGSTGAPTVFYEDGIVSALSWANEWRLKSWFGLAPGQREARLVRGSLEQIRSGGSGRGRRWMWNQVLLPGVNLSEREYDFIVERLREFRPKSIWAFTSAAAGLARYLRERGHPSPPSRPSLIITWAAPLSDPDKVLLQSVFDCDVTNIYGLREVGHIGAVCPAGSLHVFQDSHYVETDENGEILVTFLRPSPMPLIRYRTGDVGEVGFEACGCGRSLQVIKRFHGRTDEIYHTPDGRMFSPNFWCRVFMSPRLAEAVRRFQIIYTREGPIRLRLVTDSPDRAPIENILRQTVLENFGPGRRVDFDYPGDIAPSLSGKYRMVIVESKEEERP